ncbi:IQ domain-containing protein K-like [Amphibalanus amphitrite]|uniref:IQ domain-containing protein K-like n=1 Tax=Amphibalanus amphitrite TaxID=1232801 RepID=UPI001C9148B8|nr:IQ domain-containing protein K-like [Amphibalanus amphitrite]
MSISASAPTRVMSTLGRDVMPGDAVLDCDANDVQEDEVAELVALYADTCALPCETILFLEESVLPVLGDAFRALVIEIRRQRSVERAYSRLNALDFLTSHLYSNNPLHPDRPPHDDLMHTELAARLLKCRPRRPLPLCLRLTDERAASVVQRWYRGYLVRRRTDVAQLRQYQARLRRLARQEGAPTGPVGPQRRSGRACR